MFKYAAVTIGVLIFLVKVAMVPIHARIVVESIPAAYTEVVYCRDYFADTKAFGWKVAFSLINPEDIEACQQAETLRQ